MTNTHPCIAHSICNKATHHLSTGEVTGARHTLAVIDRQLLHIRVVHSIVTDANVVTDGEVIGVAGITVAD